MGPGQFRRMIVPPEYAYGNTQVQEIPSNSTLTADLSSSASRRGRERVETPVVVGKDGRRVRIERKREG